MVVSPLPLADLGTTGALLGLAVGNLVGLALGLIVGSLVGAVEGSLVGSKVGATRALHVMFLILLLPASATQIVLPSGITVMPIGLKKRA